MAVPHDMHRGRLFRKYMLLIMSLVSLALLVSGGISLYFTYRETTAALASLQQEKAIERGLAHRAVPAPGDAAAATTRRCRSSAPATWNCAASSS